VCRNIPSRSLESFPILSICSRKRSGPSTNASLARNSNCPRELARPPTPLALARILAICKPGDDGARKYVRIGHPRKLTKAEMASIPTIDQLVRWHSRSRWTGLQSPCVKRRPRRGGAHRGRAPLRPRSDYSEARVFRGARCLAESLSQSKRSLSMGATNSRGPAANPPRGRSATRAIGLTPGTPRRRSRGRGRLSRPNARQTRGPERGREPRFTKGLALRKTMRFRRTSGDRHHTHRGVSEIPEVKLIPIAIRLA
jgi:hypothetical protein